jgi:1,4-dihydroxy-2-naphthoate octaprenyltransferase
MIRRATLLHLRIPFSFFLMPVFAFALSQAGPASPGKTLLLWAIWHLLVFPASNAFNSYYDRDTESIGGLRHPPQVSRQLLVASLSLDALAIALSLVISLQLALVVFVYGLASKAYSHPAIRLKRSPWASTLVTVVFQGAVTYYGCYVALAAAPPWGLLWAASILASLLILGAYPITQIYQHASDAGRGDRTLSMALGIRGTFLFTGLVFALAGLGFMLYFKANEQGFAAPVFALCLMPVLGYFAYWAALAWNHPQKADFDHSMRLNWLASSALLVFFSWLFVERWLV